MSKAIAAEAHRIRIFTAAKLGERAHLDALLDAFAAEQLDPTHAGKTERQLGDYDRAALVAAVTGGEQRVVVLARRGKQPTYQCTFRAQPAGLTSIKVDFGAMAEPERAYALADRLAAHFHPIYGTVQPKLKDGDDFNGAGNLELHDLAKTGPHSAAARTWYGPPLVEVLGAARIGKAGHVTKPAWGGLRLDLVESPWEASAAALKQAWAAAEAALAPSGALGNYERVPFKAGPSWKPLEGAQ